MWAGVWLLRGLPDDGTCDVPKHVDLLSQDSVVSKEIRLWTYSLAFSSPKCSDQLYGPPASSSVGSLLKVKQKVHEIDHSPPSSAEVKNECSTFNPPMWLHGAKKWPRTTLPFKYHS